MRFWMWGFSPLLMLTLTICPAHAEGRKLAVVVGVDIYRSNALLPPLRYAAADAAALSMALRNAGYDVVEMTHAVAREPGKELFAPNSAYIRDQIDGILNSPNLGANDTVLVALSGHGVQFELTKEPADNDRDTEAVPRFFFCPADASLDGVATANDLTDRNHLIPLHEIYESLNQCTAATKLLIVDACRNDPTRPSITRAAEGNERLPKLPAPPGGIAAFFSCKANQVAIEAPNLQQGVFSYYLTKGLRGAADQPVLGGPGDGQVSLSELTSYVANHTYEYVFRNFDGLKQSPDIKGEFDTNLVISPVVPPPSRPPGSPYDWPMFRGPGATGVAKSAQPPIEWGGPTDRNIKWKVPLPGPAPSSPIIVGDFVFITCASEIEAAEKNDEMSDVKHHLLCFDRRTGEQLWEQTIDGQANFGAGRLTVQGLPAASTPASDGRFVYSFFGLAGVFAHTLEGELVWQESLKQNSDAEPGFATGWRGASPVVHGNRVYVNALNDDRSVYCLNVSDGSINWNWSPPGDVTYVNCTMTPVVFDSPEGAFLTVVGDGWQRIEATTGRSKKILDESSSIPIATPQRFADLILLPGRGGKKSLRAYQIPDSSGNSSEPTVFEKCGSYTVTPLVMGNQVYGVTHGRVLWSLAADDILSSNELAQPRNKRGPFRGKIFASLVSADRYLYLVTENEGAFVYRPGEHGFGEPVAKNIIIGDDSAFCGTPAVSGDELFLRSNKFLYCIAEH